MTLHGCWTSIPRPHPWYPEIQDCACGFDERLTSPRCTGCHRARPESPHQHQPRRRCIVSKIQALQQQLADAEREAQAIRAELDEAVSVGRSQAITEIQALMVEWDITLADLGCQRRTRRAKQPDQTPEPIATDTESSDAVEDAQEATQEPLQEAA